MLIQEKTVITLHGAGMHAGAWDRLAKELPCQALSLPGHGENAGPALTVIEDMADWVSARIEDAPPQSVVLVGHSMGALVALEAARSPAVEGLVLMGAAAAMPVNPDLLRQAADAPDVASGLILKWGVAKQHPEAAVFLKDRMQPAALACDLAACNDYVTGEVTAKACGKPALVISGPDDKLVKAAAAQTLADMLPRGRFCSLSGCGHMPMAEDPFETAREIKDFIAALAD